MALSYGHSHFFNNVLDASAPDNEGGFFPRLREFAYAKAILLPLLFTLLGSVTQALLLFGVAVLGVGRRGLFALFVVLVLGTAWIALDDERYLRLPENVLELFTAFEVPRDFVLADCIYFLSGMSVLLVIGVVVQRLLEVWTWERETRA